MLFASPSKVLKSKEVIRFLESNISFNSNAKKSMILQGRIGMTADDEARRETCFAFAKFTLSTLLCCE